MTKVFKKTLILRYLCVLFLAMLLLVPETAEAANLTVSSGTTKNYTAEAAGGTLSVTLSDAYTSVSLMGKPEWVTQSGSGASRKITIQKNTSTSSRTGNVTYRDGSKTYTIKITQKGVSNTVTVKFNNNGGYGNVPSQTYTIGKTYGSLPGAPTPPKGMKFDGWYTKSSGGTQIKTSTKVSASYTTLFAHYSNKKYTVKFDTDGGSSVSPKTVTYSETYGTLKSPTKPGYTFAGWYTDPKGDKKVSAATKVTTTSDHTLYARWNAIKVSVSFNSNGGSTVKEKTVAYNSTYGTLATPTRKGYTFLGWYTAASDGTKIQSSTKMTKTSNHTLYAQWKGDPITINFQDNVIQSHYAIRTYQVGSKFGSLPSGPKPPKLSQKFDGWWTKKEGGTKISSKSIVSPDYTTLYAHYVYDPEAFFKDNQYKEPGIAKVIPENSSIKDSKKIGNDEYMDLFKNRSSIYNTQGLRTQDYIQGVRTRALAVLDVAKAAGTICTPDAAALLNHYLHGDGSRYDYSAHNYVFDRSVGTKTYNKTVNDLMRKMEAYLLKGKRLTFVDKDSKKNKISFTDAGWDDINGFLAVKEGYTGVSGSCSYDGSVYRMDLYFYVQDYYDFYYKDGDPNSQASFDVLGICLDELAFLVPFGYAKPFESCAVFHARISWYEGQKADILTSYTPLTKGQPYAEIYQYTK